MSSLHIGHKIRQRAKQLNIGSSLLASLVHTSKQNLNGIFKRRTIHADMLKKMSKALDFDFFQYYTDSESKKVKALESQIADLKKENAYLKKINELLEKGKRAK